jgi:hypothetical protein
MSADRPRSLPIDVSRHLAAHSAMAKLRGRVLVTRETFGAAGHTARVLVEGEYYDVDDRELSRLRAGASPADLELHPVGGTD